MTKLGNELNLPADRAEILVPASKTFKASRLRRGRLAVSGVAVFALLVGGAVWALAATSGSKQDLVAVAVAVFAVVIAAAAAASAPDGKQLNLRLEAVIDELRLLRAAQHMSSTQPAQTDCQKQAEEAIFDAITKLAKDAAARRGRRGAVMARDAANALNAATEAWRGAAAGETERRHQ